MLDEDHDTVVGVGTFSKSYSPGMRVGWGILPAELVAPVCSQKGNIDFGSPNFNQHIMHRVLERGLFDEHVGRIRGNYRGKLQAMLEAAEEELGSVPGVTWERPAGGLYVWVQLPEGVDAGPDGAFVRRGHSPRRAVRARAVLLSGRGRTGPEEHVALELRGADRRTHSGRRRGLGPGHPPIVTRSTPGRWNSDADV